MPPLLIRAFLALTGILKRGASAIAFGLGSLKRTRSGNINQTVDPFIYATN